MIETFGKTTFTKFLLPFIFLHILHTILFIISQNKLARQDVPFAVLGHILFIPLSCLEDDLDFRGLCFGLFTVVGRWASAVNRDNLLDGQNNLLGGQPS